MRTTALALLTAAGLLAGCQTPPPPAEPPAPTPTPAPAPVRDAQDPNLKAIPSAPVGRQSLPPAAPR